MQHATSYPEGEPVHDCPLLTHLDLFAGIGGFSLAAAWTGRIETVALCENNRFCQSILQAHWPNTPLFDDIRTLSKTRLQQQGIATIDLITGGFPCQPFSIAGKRRGTADDRHLWPEMCRLISELRPRWVIGENVAHFVRMALDECLFDLEGAGYEAWPLVIPACALNAPHRRDRVWIIARRTEDVADPLTLRTLLRCQTNQHETRPLSEPTNGRDALADADQSGLEGYRRLPQCAGQQPVGKSRPAVNPGRGAQPGLGRTPDGVSAGVDDNRQQREEHRRLGSEIGHGWPHGWEQGVSRLTTDRFKRRPRLQALGNAIVPQVAFAILNQIFATEVQPTT